MQLATSSLDYSAIPGQTRLFLDYVSRSPSVLPFYARPPDLSSLAKLGREEILPLRYPRAEVAEILRRQNIRFGSGAKTLAAIDDLSRPEGLAVVTGQQVGLFSGPLYTVYKAFTAIRLAELLRQSGLRAVPLFWMETEDHDLAEITRAAVLERSGKFRALDFPFLRDDPSPAPARSVGDRSLPSSISRALDEYLSSLDGYGSTPVVRKALAEAYFPGATYASAFARLLAGLFAEYGLVLYDAQDPSTKPLVSDLFRYSISHAATIRGRLIERNLALTEAGYHAQVPILENSSILFFYDGKQRRALTQHGECFFLKGSDRSFTAAELLESARKAPSLFSPSVLLRPLVQDQLFPTVAYVGGPAEVAYFAQVEVLYRSLGRPMPVIWPRASLTFVDPETRAVMIGSGIRFEDCLLGKGHLVGKILAATASTVWQKPLEELEVLLEEGLDEVRHGFVDVHGSLGAALTTARRKILHRVGWLRNRYLLRESRAGDAADRADRVLGTCFPQQSLQERAVNIGSLVARQGFQVLDSIYRLVDVESFRHTLVYFQ